MTTRKKMHHPVAVCDRCGVYSYNIHDTGKDCFETFEGNPCPGTIASAVELHDWDECPMCNGAGSSLVGSCDACQGSGWTYRGHAHRQ